MIVTVLVSASSKPFLAHVPFSHRALLRILDVHDARSCVDVRTVCDNRPSLAPFRWYARPFQCLFVFPVLPSELNQFKHGVPSLELGIVDETGSGYRGEREWLDV